MRSIITIQTSLPYAQALGVCWVGMTTGGQQISMVGLPSWLCIVCHQTFTVGYLSAHHPQSLKQQQCPFIIIRLPYACEYALCQKTSCSWNMMLILILLHNLLAILNNKIFVFIFMSCFHTLFRAKYAEQFVFFCCFLLFQCN